MYFKYQRRCLCFLLAAAMLLCVIACGKPADESKSEISAATESKEPESKEPESKEPESKEPTIEEQLEAMRLNYEKVTAGKNLQKYDDAAATREKESQDKGKIVFIGSSMFTRWSTKYDMTNLEDDMLSSTGQKVCINHGLGGSNIAHNLYNYERMIKNYEPKAVVLSTIYNYTTDFNFTLKQVVDMTKYLVEQIHYDFPDIKIYFEASSKYLISKQYILAEMKKYAETHDYFVYVPIDLEASYYADTTGHVGSTDFQKDVYKDDNVHFTRLGYSYYMAYWKEALKDELK